MYLPPSPWDRDRGVRSGLSLLPQSVEDSTRGTRLDKRVEVLGPSRHPPVSDLLRLFGERPDPSASPEGLPSPPGHPLSGLRVLYSFLVTVPLMEHGQSSLYVRGTPRRTLGPLPSSTPVPVLAENRPSSSDGRDSGPSSPDPGPGDDTLPLPTVLLPNPHNHLGHPPVQVRSCVTKVSGTLGTPGE